MAERNKCCCLPQLVGVRNRVSFENGSTVTCISFQEYFFNHQLEVVDINFERGNLSSRFPTRSYTNRALRLQKGARGLKFRYLDSRCIL